MDDNKLLEKYKSIWTKIEDLKTIDLNALPIYDDRYIKTKKRTYDEKFYTRLDVPKNGVECKSFTVISIDSLLFYDGKYYLQVYLGSCACKVVDNPMIDYLDDNLFEADGNHIS